MANYLSAEATQKAMLYGLNSHLRAALRERFEAAAKEIIEEAIDSAMKTFETSIKQYTQPERFGETIQVLLTDRRDRTQTPENGMTNFETECYSRG